MSLNPKQEQFVAEYLIDLNGKQAAIRAGYAAHSAEVTASRLLRLAKVRDLIRAAQLERSQQVKIDQNWVVERLVEVTERCMQHKPVFDRTGKPVKVETPEGEEACAYTFDAKGANGALALLAKHTGGFTERHEHAGPGGGPIQIEGDLVLMLAKLSPEERAGLRAMALKLEGQG